MTATDRITLHNVFDEEPTVHACNPFLFSGGEPHVQFDPQQRIEAQCLWVDARIATPAGFMQLLATLDALKAMRPRALGLFLPYFPGARQDRRQPGAPFTLQLYTDAIDRLDLDAVVTFDPHSDVLGALLGAEVIHPHEVMPPRCSQAPLSGWICPDAGAEKRVYAAAKALGIKTILHARKHRDTSTGKLTGFSCESLPGSGRYLVVDDICDGGGTFDGLGDMIYAADGHMTYTLDLWVSHGIFSKGLSALIGRYSTIFTTDSFLSKEVTDALENPQINRGLVVTELHRYAAAVMRRRIGC